METKEDIDRPSGGITIYWALTTTRHCAWFHSIFLKPRDGISFSFLSLLFLHCFLSLAPCFSDQQAISLMRASSRLAMPTSNHVSDLKAWAHDSVSWGEDKIRMNAIRDATLKLRQWLPVALGGLASPKGLDCGVINPEDSRDSEHQSHWWSLATCFTH